MALIGRHASILSALAVLVSLAPIAARAADSTRSTSLSLSGPTIVKADWETVLLRAGDLNGDGRNDLVAVNNSKSLLEIYTQQEKDARPRFEKREEVLEETIADLELDDFNEDGRADLLLASLGKSLALRYQREDGTLAPPVALDAQGGMVRAGDLDRDGRRDLLVLTPEKAQILYGSDAKSLEKAQSQEFFSASSPGTRPRICDLDGNGLDDIVYLDSKRRSSILVRFQNAPRQWGLESGFEISDSADLVALRPAQDAERKNALLLAIDSKTRELRLYGLEPEAKAGGKLPLDGPYFLASDPRTQSDRESLVACDLTGQGRTSLVAASPGAAEIGIYAQDAQGGLGVRSAPSLLDITALAVIERPSSAALVFSLSGQEETMGASTWDPVRGLTAPQLLDADSKPLAMAAADFDGSGKPDLIYLYKDAQERLTVATIADPTGPEALRAEPTTRTLPGAEDDEPVALMAGDVDGDGRCDLLVFDRYNPMRLVLQREGGALEAFATDQGMKKGIFNKVRPAQIALADLDADGHNEMLIAREGFVRAYRLSPDGNLEVVEQLNGRDGASRIASVAVADLDGDGKSEVALLDSASKLLTLYARNDSGAFALVRHHEAESLRGARLLTADLNGDGLGDLVACEGDRAQVYYSGPGARRLKPLWRRAPEEKEGKYAVVASRPLLGSGDRDDLLALEGTDNLLEIFTIEPGDPVEPRRLASFKVFDDEASASGNRDLRNRTVPRAIETSDLDGDGTLDLLLLLHDNILCYSQAKP